MDIVSLTFCLKEFVSGGVNRRNKKYNKIIKYIFFDELFISFFGGTIKNLFKVTKEEAVKV
jgi:hypothetical protein